MGRENLGYKGMLPLGQSYVLGQWVLHLDVPPDPADASLPHPDYLDGFYEAYNGVNLDKTHWTQKDHDDYHAAALADVVGIRSLYQAYLMNGPLPVDGETTSGASAGLWQTADQIEAERHIYFYDNQENYGGSGARGAVYGLVGAPAKYVQIQGFTKTIGTPKGSSDPGAWVLPRAFSSGGQQVFAWRYAADHAGPPYDNSKWTGVFNFGEWINDSQGDMATWFMVIWGAIFTLITMGIGSAVAVPLATAIGVSVAVVMAALTALDAMVIGAIRYAVTGDSTGLMAALQQAGAAAVQMEPQVLAALESNPATKDAAAFLKNVATKVSDVVDSAKTALEAGKSEIDTLLGEATGLAHTFPLINEDYWNMAKGAIGGQFAPGSYFLNLTRMASSVSDLSALAGQVPWYATGFLQFGATIRAAEIQQAAIWQQQAGFGAHVAAPKFDPSYATQAAPGPKQAPIGQQAHTSVMLTPVAPTKSPDQILKGAKGAGKVPAPLVLAAGVGVAWWLGLLKFLF